MKNQFSLAIVLALFSFSLQVNAQTNYINTSEWVDGADPQSMTYFNIGSTPVEHHEISNGEDPFGEISPLWVISSGSSTYPGTNTEPIALDYSKTYRFSVWVKQSSSFGANIYLKVNPYNDPSVINAGGVGVNDLYYKGGGGAPSSEQWYLYVGYINGENDNNTYTGGIYQVGSNTSIGSVGDNGHSFTSSFTTLYIQMFTYGSSNTNDKLYIFEPSIYEINGNEPSIEDLLSSGSPNPNPGSSVWSQSTSNSDIYFDGGEVGIGTNDPISPLHVSSSYDAIQTFQTNDDNFLYTNWLSSNGTRRAYMGLNNALDEFRIHVENGTNEIIFDGGNVGIGTTSPDYSLDVDGVSNGILRHSSDYFRMFPYDASYDDGTYAKIFYDGNKKQVRFWNSDTNTNYTRLETGGLTIGSSNPVSSTNGFMNRIEFKGYSHGAIVFHPGQTDELMFGLHTDGHYYWGRGQSHADGQGYSMFLDGISGDLGIRGKLTSNEVQVKTGGWADYVFTEDYDLPTLEEVAQHIKDKGHLINIPSAAEVEANGIQLGEMNKLLLEKIEELTLYLLKQQEEIQLLKKKIK